ncbi:MAG: TonB-dependent receptor [Caulobacteraceae bacterium]|nr:TonB-dependent receptor [Caulobacteraceae bacterium]
MRLFTRASALFAASSILAIATAAHAADAPPPAAPAAPAQGGAVIEELVVTAQKREEALQDVPIAVSAFSAKSLASQRIDGGANLVLAVPNVSFSKTSYTGYNFQIRGIGAALVATSSDSGVGIHENNAPLTSNRLFEAEFYDVERVEVLRGPQGTLYGRNATGGLVNIITATPTSQREGSITGEYGNFNTTKVKGFVNMPFTDTFSVRFAGSYLSRDGFTTNQANGQKVDGRDLYSTRLTAQWQPVESFKASLMWEHFQEDDDRLRRGRTLCVKDTGPAAVGGVPTGGLRNFLSQGCLPGSLYSSAAYSQPNSTATLGGLLGNLTGLITGDAYAGSVQSADLRRAQISGSPTYRAKNDLVQLNMVWNVTDDLTFTSLTSSSRDFVNSRQDSVMALPNGPFNSTPFAPGGMVNDPQIGASNIFQTYDISTAKSRQISQEFRLQSNYAGPLNFSVGGIYLKYHTDSQYYVFSNTLTAYAQVNNLQNANNPAGQIYIDPSNPPSGVGHNYYLSQTPYDLTSKALFGEVYYKLTDDLKVTGGLRYTDDAKKAVNYPIMLLAPGQGLTASGTQYAKFKETTGRLNIDWSPKLSFTDRTLIYASYSRGYKGGGFNPPAAVASPPTYAPEFVDAYEIGTKNTLLNGSLLLNLTGFYYNYSGYQIAKIVNKTAVNENIDAKIYGAEFESIWEPVRRLRFNANIGYLDTEISNGSSIDTLNRTQGNPALTVVKAKDGSNCVAPTAGVAGVLAIIQGLPGAPNVPGVTGTPSAILGICAGAYSALGVTPSEGVPVGLKGKELPNSPHWTVSLGAQYRWDFASDWSATLRGDYYHQSESYARIFNTVADRLQAWDNVNATLTVSNKSWGFDAQLYVKNLLNDDVITGTALSDDSQGLATSLFLNEPRTFGLALTKSF